MRRTTTTILTIAMTAGVGLGLAACSKSEPTTLKVTVSEWVVQPAPRSVAGGTVRITADNVGSYEHELIVAKGDAASLSRKPDGSIDEKATKGVIGEIGGLTAGDAKVKEFDLPKGTYTLFCNIVQDIDGMATSHFQKGMHTTLTVS